MSLRPKSRLSSDLTSPSVVLRPEPTLPPSYSGGRISPETPSIGDLSHLWTPSRPESVRRRNWCKRRKRCFDEPSRAEERCQNPRQRERAQILETPNTTRRRHRSGREIRKTQSGPVLLFVCPSVKHMSARLRSLADGWTVESGPRPVTVQPGY